VPCSVWASCSASGLAGRYTEKRLIAFDNHLVAFSAGLLMPFSARPPPAAELLVAPQICGDQDHYERSRWPSSPTAIMEAAIPGVSRPKSL
jgi:hypothetical protein